MITLTSTDDARYVDIGSSGIMQCLQATVSVRLKKYIEEIPLAYRFIHHLECASQDGYETARQINLLRDELAKHKPDEIVFDEENLELLPPWGTNISPVTTSCANYFTTADGKDLLYEFVCILVYAQVMQVDVVCY